MDRIFNDNPTWSQPMPVSGQGVFIFNIIRDNPFQIVLTKSTNGDRIILTIGNGFVELGISRHYGLYKRLEISTQPHCGYEADKRISYWFSYNRDDLVLKHGKGYIMEETTLLEFNILAAATQAEEVKIRSHYHSLFNVEHRGIIELYDSVRSTKSRLTNMDGMVSFHRNPLTYSLSPIVLDSSVVTLLTLDNNKYMLSGSLPPACKDLYENIRNCELNWPTDVDDGLLSDAIRFSIETEGCILYEKLRSKAGEIRERSGEENTYLRVTLGHILGNSPGIPYVLEIWPSGHSSPIHNHGNANAVIKVLFGEINVSIYNKDTTDPTTVPIKTFNASLGDVTWINRNWFQTHKLWNNTTDFCATIQCYSYDADDTINCPYFYYVSKNSTIEEFLPNSDFTFSDMRQKVMREYQQSVPRKNSLNQQPQDYIKVKS